MYAKKLIQPDKDILRREYCGSCEERTTHERVPEKDDTWECMRCGQEMFMVRLLHPYPVRYAV